MGIWASLKALYASQSTDRVNYALIALGVLLALAWLFQLQDQNDARRAQLEALTLRAAELEDQASLQEWGERARRAADLAHEWNVRQWSGPTPGIISAEIQAVLREAAEKSDLAQVQITVDPDPLDVDGRPVLRFELFGRARTRNGLSFLVDLAALDKRVLLAEATFTPSPLRAQIRLSGVAPIRVEAAEDEQPEEAAEAAQ